VAAKFDHLPATTANGLYIPKARELAKSLSDFLDGLEDTDQDKASDDVACDDPEDEEEEKLSQPDEPSLGATERSHLSRVRETDLKAPGWAGRRRLPIFRTKFSILKEPTVREIQPAGAESNAAIAAKLKNGEFPPRGLSLDARSGAGCYWGTHPTSAVLSDAWYFAKV
jgi:hypothetical protein